jgi:hypothetical protein
MENSMKVVSRFLLETFIEKKKIFSSKKKNKMESKTQFFFSYREKKSKKWSFFI